MTTKIVNQRALWILLPLLTLFNLSTWAATWTWTAGSGEQEWFAAKTSGQCVLNGKKWYFTRTNTNTTAFASSSIQFGKQSYVDDVVFYSNAIGGTITQIDVMSSSYSAKHNIKIEVGNTTVLASQATANGTTPGNKSTGTISATGPIKITFTSTSGARYLYVKSITVTYTSGTANVNWVVGGTTTKSETGVSTGTPPSVADNALGGSCSSLKFLGWSETNIGDDPSSAPFDLFDANEVPPTSGNKTYYAVFGNVATNTSDTVLVQYPRYDTWSYTGTTTDKSTYRLFAKDAYVQSGAFDVSRLAKVIVKARWFSAASYGNFAIKDANGNSWTTGSAGTNGLKEYIFRSGSSLSGHKAMQVIATSSGADGSSKGLGISDIRYYVFPKSYSNCVSMCTGCSDLAPLNGSVFWTTLFEPVRPCVEPAVALFYLVIISVFQRSFA